MFQVIDLGTEETRIGKWNLMMSTTFPDAAVRLGDVIVSVNDMRDIYDMRSQIAKADITSFEFLVRERDECPVGGGDSSDGPPLPRTSKHVQFIDEADMVVS